ncbi:MAG: helix-turn-helix transcriptional regulator [bacterium]|nr:helix-turn-helix transcriptional regulator [bacterium]
MNALRIITDSEIASQILNPERQELLDLLKESNSASSLARITHRPRQQINYHLHELEKRGFIKHVEDRKRGNCVERVLIRTNETIYFSPDILGKLAPTPELEPDKLSASFLFATAAKLLRNLGRVMQIASEQKKKVATLTLSSEISFANADERAKFATEVTEALTRISAKYNSNSPGSRKFAWMFGSYPVAAETNEGE